ncbi:hypothetical protein [Aeromonas bivalvium]|uniref:hypothetical protein n=1 Tax=Aeromonas bivalvium TaxID=440079 RepID=UPI0038D0C212
MDKEKLIELIMKEPSPLEATEYEEKIRRNLLISSMIAIMSLFLGITPTEQVEIWGLKFQNVTMNSIYVVLLAIIIYELGHYCWIVFNKFSYWRVRLTGSKLGTYRGSAGGFGSDDPQEDTVGDEINSTFYNWMIERAHGYHALIDLISNQKTELDMLSRKVLEEEPNPEARSKIELKVNALNDSVERLSKYLDSVRISESMRRFDKWFDMVIKSQSRRWFILDCIFPISVGFFAFIYLLNRMIVLHQDFINSHLIMLSSFFDFFGTA